MKRLARNPKCFVWRWNGLALHCDLIARHAVRPASIAYCDKFTSLLPGQDSRKTTNGKFPAESHGPNMMRDSALRTQIDESAQRIRRVCSAESRQASTTSGSEVLKHWTRKYAFSEPDYVSRLAWLEIEVIVTGDLVNRQCHHRPMPSWSFSAADAWRPVGSGSRFFTATMLLSWLWPESSHPRRG